MNGHFLDKRLEELRKFWIRLLDVIITATCRVTVYRATDGDWLVNLKDVRHSTGNFVTFVKWGIIMFFKRLKYGNQTVLFLFTD